MKITTDKHYVRRQYHDALIGLKAQIEAEINRLEAGLLVYGLGTTADYAVKNSTVVLFLQDWEDPEIQS